VRLKRSDYGKHWPLFSKVAVIATGRRCESCGSDGNGYPLQVHHLLGRIWDNSAYNLMVLCGRCHRPLNGNVSTYPIHNREREALRLCCEAITVGQGDDPRWQLYEGENTAP